MSYISGFSDNQTIGVDDLNAITARLVTSGIGMGLSANGSIEVEALNGASAAVVTDGVVPDSNTSLKVTAGASGTVSIAPGLAFFADGSFLRVTEAEALSVPEGESYIYLVNDTSLNEKKPVAAANMPDNGDFVPLAHITADGELEDKRRYAKGRVPAYSSYAGFPMIIRKSIVCSRPTVQQEYMTGSVSVELGNVPTNGVAINVANGAKRYRGVYFFSDNSYGSVVDVGSAPSNRVFTDGLYKLFDTGGYYEMLKFSLSADGGGSKTLTINAETLTRSGNNLTHTCSAELIIF